MLQLAIREETNKILRADEDDAEAHEAGSEDVIPPDFHLIAADFDHPARRLRAEHRPRHAIHERGVSLIQHSKLVIDIFTHEKRRPRIETDDKDVESLAAFAAAPLRISKIERCRQRDLRCGPRLIQLAEPEFPGLDLIFVTV